MANLFTHKKIYSDKTLGEKLRMYRKRKHLSLEQAEEETKVRIKYLTALENGDYGDLPASVYTIGFLAKYADFLGADKDELLKDYKRERNSVSMMSLAPKMTLSESKFFLTPKTIIIGFLILAFLGLAGYIFYAVKNFTSPPNLKISSPVADTVIREDHIEVVGKTDQGVTVRINDQTISIDDRGNFRENIKLQPGLNNIEVRSTNRVKKETVKVIQILAEY